MNNKDVPVMTTSNGAPVGDNQNSLTAGERGPIVISDFSYFDKIAAFDRERIPERVVHAKGAGAKGYFEVTADLTKWTKAKFLNQVGKRTPMIARFSTVGGEKGSADTERDPRGFALKFYTEEGNYDLVGNNTPIFFIRDPQKFPDFIHTQKRNPQTNCKDPDAFWDFLSLTPESAHQVSFLFSDRGTPDGYRKMHGFGSHTFKWVNEKGDVSWVKYHFRTDEGIKNFTAQEADAIKASDADYATRDLFNHIDSGKSANWSVFIQRMSYEEGLNFEFDIFDVTKVWPHKEHPLIPIGKMVLNQNPDNYFAEIEQVAFAPIHFVPGIEASMDKMLQGRLFSYADTHRHRLGVNYQQIPVNCPYRTKVINGQRDGNMSVAGNQGNNRNYEPNSFSTYREDKPSNQSPYQVNGLVQRYSFNRDKDFIQPGNFYRDVMKGQDRDNLISNIVGHLKNAKREIQERQVKVFASCDPDYGARIAKGLGFSSIKSKL